MKKLPLIVVLVVIAVVGLLFIQSNRSSSTNASKGPSKSGVDKNAVQRNARIVVAGDAAQELFDSDALRSIRLAIESGDKDAIGRAFEYFNEYIKAHPENMDEYIAGLRTEQNEHILRALALAMAENQLPWNDKLAATAIEMAKDRSIEQRQHIMLHLMSSCPEIRPDLNETVLELSRNDPNVQVRNSAVAVMADWLEKMPEDAEPVLGQVADLFKAAIKDKNSKEEHLVWLYQILKVHSEKLTPEVHGLMVDQLKVENDYNSIPLVMALAAAPEHLREAAAMHIESRFQREQNLEMQRVQLLQLVCLKVQGALPLLTQRSTGNSLLSDDARRYITLFKDVPDITNEQILMDYMEREAQRVGVPRDPHDNH